MSAGGHWRNLALTPLGKPTVVTVMVIGAGIPAAVAGLAAVRAHEDAVTPLGALAMLFMTMLIASAILLPLLRREVAFNGHALRVKAAWFTRESPLSAFDLAGARIVDLRERSELRPWLRTLGFALPGLRAGHYRRRDGGQVFCLVTTPERVLLLPHSDGRTWLLSLRNPQAALDVLRRAAG